MKIHRDEIRNLLREDREKIGDMIDGTDVAIETSYKGLDRDLQEEILEALGLSQEELEGYIRKLRAYRGYRVEAISFGDQELVIQETTIKNQEDFMASLDDLDSGLFTRILDLENIDEAIIGRLNSQVREERLIVYRDISPELIDDLLSSRDISISRIFHFFEKLSMVKGYKPLSISLSQEGMLVRQELIRSQEEYEGLKKLYRELSGQ